MQLLEKSWSSIFVLMLLRVVRVQTSEVCLTGCRCQSKNSQEHMVCEVYTNDNSVPALSKVLDELPPTITHLLMRITVDTRTVKLPFSVPQSTELQVLLLDILNVHGICGICSFTVYRHSFPVNNKLEVFHSHVRVLMSADALSSLHSLKSLRLTGTDMNWASVPQFVAKSLCDKTSLMKLNLAQFSIKERNSPSQVRFSPRDVFARCKMPTVQHLDLSQNRIRYLEPGFLDTFPGLRVLILERNLLTSARFFTGHSSSMNSMELFSLPLHTMLLGEQGRENIMKRDFTESDLLSTQNFTIPQAKIQCSSEKSLQWLPRTDIQRENDTFLEPLSNPCLSWEILTIQNMKATFNTSAFDQFAGRNISITGSLPDVGLSYIDGSNNDYIDYFAGSDGSPFNSTSFNKILTYVPRLKYLNLQATNFPAMFDHKQLERNNPHLDTLLLGRNPKLGKSMANLGDIAFSHPTLKSLDLANSNIEFLPDTFLGRMPLLQCLNLSGNQLHDITSNWSAYPHLQFLNLRNNLIDGISNWSWKSIGIKSNLTIDLSDNPLQCGCQNIEFLKWFQGTSMRFHDMDKLRCSHTFNGLVSMNLVDVMDLQRRCYPPITRLVLISVSCTSIFFLALGLAIALYLKRWKIRFWWFATKSSWTRFKARSDPALYEFDAFVAHDYDDFGWIQQQLVPKLEDENQLKLSFGEKDFPAGSILTEVIVDYIKRSRKTLLLLTPKFIQSRWCDFEVSMARNQLFDSGRDVIVAIILKPLPKDTINRTLSNILQKKLYLEWHYEDMDAQRLFWAKLVDALRH